MLISHDRKPPMLAERAERLWPDSPALQEEWLRAVAIARMTTKGWLADPRKPVVKGKPATRELLE